MSNFKERLDELLDREYHCNHCGWDMQLSNATVNGIRQAIIDLMIELVGDDFLPPCLTYPDSSTYCNKCKACKTNDNQDFNEGYEYKTEELINKLRGTS